ncbi:hypothetical protein IV203_011682 [Nitzschia inconspicua]|uniref:Uncharacterized protein n=1 Tax=Nitzschia inconspicua TaxID=303405 RepID=A0A9K3KSJ6_9STRA|nr:hypothetical protein IV203_011682 [Nitzschia inconspicua]
MKLLQNLIFLASVATYVDGKGKPKKPSNKPSSPKNHGCNDNANRNGNSKNKGCLYQADFDNGTVIISKPGMYRLCENISFRPNFPVEMNDIVFERLFDPDLTAYNPNAFGLGFFCAIAIQSNDVELDLNGFTLEQSPEHALMQRFFALIELASAPFIKNVGPAEFVGEKGHFAAATKVVIKGPGTLGRSSHHGIHGNQNSDVTIRKVTFRDFEVAAVSLNNVDGLKIQRCNVLQNRWDVPVTGIFSAARFIRPYVKKLMENRYSMIIRGEEVWAAKVYDDLITAIRNVFDDVVANGFIDASAHPEEFRLFDNPKRVVDGPCYGFLVHGLGPAIADFGYYLSKNESETSSDIIITRNAISNLTCWNDEVLAAVEGSRVVNDIRGAVFQFEKTFETGESRFLAINSDGTYKGNIVADAQVMVANAILENNITDSPGLQVGPVNSINEKIIRWAKGVGENDKVYTPKYRCNGDSMHHVVKGLVGIRVDKVTGADVHKNVIKNITNLSEKPFGNCFDYHFTSPENAREQQLGNVRGIALSAVGGFPVTPRDENDKGTKKDAAKPNNVQPKQSKISYNEVIGASSLHANKIVGIDVQGLSTDILVLNNVVDLDLSEKKNGQLEKMVGLRIRSNVFNCIERGNVLKNGVVKEVIEIGGVRRRRVEASPKGLPAGHIHNEMIHSETPGCPFAHMRYVVVRYTTTTIVGNLLSPSKCDTTLWIFSEYEGPNHASMLYYGSNLGYTRLYTKPPGEVKVSEAANTSPLCDQDRTFFSQKKEELFGSGSRTTYTLVELAIMMSLREASSSSRRNPDFLAGLFDDIAASRVLDEMNLCGSYQEVGRKCKRDARDYHVEVPLSLHSEPCRPRKKCRILSPFSASSFRSRGSKRNLAELSFPPLEEALKASSTMIPPPRSTYTIADSSLPVPHISISRHRQVGDRLSFGTESSSSKTIMACSSPCTHIIVPDHHQMEVTSPRKTICISDESNFGWFVDLDNPHHREEGSKNFPYKRQVSFPSSSPSSSSQDCSKMDFLPHQGSTASHNSQDTDAELEWAMAVDTIDSIFGDIHCKDS